MRLRTFGFCVLLLATVTVVNPTHIARADAAPCDESAKFCALAPIPGLTDSANTSVVNSDSLAAFLNNLYKYLIGVAATAAVVMIIWGGIDISTTDSIGNQSAGRARIKNAIGGLILVLMPVVVFSVINPSILNLSINLPALDTKSNTHTQEPATIGGGCSKNSDCASNICKPNILSNDLPGTCVATLLKARGEECNANEQCLSGECDTTNRSPGVCRDRSVESSLVPDGGSCTANSECKSTVCEAANNKCAAVGDFPTNASCTRNEQCRSKQCSLHGDGRYACNSGEVNHLF